MHLPQLLRARAGFPAASSSTGRWATAETMKLSTATVPRLLQAEKLRGCETVVFLQSHRFVLNPEEMIDFSPWRNSDAGLNFPCQENVRTAAWLPWGKCSKTAFGVMCSCGV